jgi:5-methylcytosine-specific restriction endonuclease McrA
MQEREYFLKPIINNNRLIGYDWLSREKPVKMVVKKVDENCDYLIYNKRLDVLLFKKSKRCYYSVKYKRMSSYKLKLNPICEKCGSEERLQVHHKNKDTSDNSIQNLMTLCYSCHSDSHNGRKLREFFRRKEVNI